MLFSSCIGCGCYHMCYYLGFHKYETPTNSRNHLGSHELNDRLKKYTSATEKEDLNDLYKDLSKNKKWKHVCWLFLWFLDSTCFGQYLRLHIEGQAARNSCKSITSLRQEMSSHSYDQQSH